MKESYSDSTPAPNQALQRTAPAVTLAASVLRLAPTTQPARQPPLPLSLGSLGGINTFMRANEINITIKCDDKGIEHYQLPTDCIPGVGDRVILDGVPFNCVAREIEKQHGIANVTIELKTSTF